MKIIKKKYTQEEKEAIYEKTNSTLRGWPNWKRKAYDNQFAQSKYAKKYADKEMA